MAPAGSLMVEVPRLLDSKSDLKAQERHARQARHMQLECSVRHRGHYRQPLQEVVQGIDGDRARLAVLRQALDEAVRSGSLGEADQLLQDIAGLKALLVAHHDSLQATQEAGQVRPLHEGAGQLQAWWREALQLLLAAVQRSSGATAAARGVPEGCLPLRSWLSKAGAVRGARGRGGAPWTRRAVRS